MSYVRKHLLEGEQIVYETRLHWSVLIRPIATALLFVLAGGTLFVLAERVAAENAAEHQAMMIAGGALLVVALFFILRGIVDRNATEMTVTNKRVFVKTGLAARRTIELLLSRVESIGVEESAMGRMFGYGSVTLHGTGGTPEVFHRIAHPLEFRTQVQQQIERIEKTPDK
jgi:uncharacterized membrane protein YdbT with pleckstrin-like domain